METKQIVRIRLDLHGKEANQFLRLLKKRGLTINTQLIRQLLKEAQERELED
jgi:antitoxin component of RelBE/YafQ-DinJ toxin-antitoxin module